MVRSGGPNIDTVRLPFRPLPNRRTLAWLPRRTTPPVFAALPPWLPIGCTPRTCAFSGGVIDGTVMSMAERLPPPLTATVFGGDRLILPGLVEGGAATPFEAEELLPPPPPPPQAVIAMAEARTRPMGQRDFTAHLMRKMLVRVERVVRSNTRAVELSSQCHFPVIFRTNELWYAPRRCCWSGIPVSAVRCPGVKLRIRIESGYPR